MDLLSYAHQIATGMVRRGKEVIGSFYSHCHTCIVDKSTPLRVKERDTYNYIPLPLSR